MMIDRIPDMAAIPDFVSGAMEHWGLVTFRETSLLYDPTISSTANKQRVAEVVSHELSHMWFGNLGKRLIMCDYLWILLLIRNQCFLLNFFRMTL